MYATIPDRSIQRHNWDRVSVLLHLCLGRLQLAKDVNENYLFHGTNPESAQCIARDFFRVERAGSSAGSMFGPGIYLAENASKSDEYLNIAMGVSF